MTRIKSKVPAGLTIGKTILMGFLSLTLIFFCTVFGFLNFYSPSSEIVDAPPIGLEPQPPDDGGVPVDDINSTGSTDETTPAEDPNANKKKNFYNFLIVGRDATSGLTDVMMIVSFDTKNKAVSVLNVPRDSYVNENLPHRANSLFNSAYNAVKSTTVKSERTNEAMKSVGAKIRQVFGIPINYTVYVDLAGFRAIVDAVGGVEVVITEKMYHYDPDQDLLIDLKPVYDANGLPLPIPQLLNGAKAEQFVRYRGYGNADIGRIDAQQQLISSLIKKCMKFDIPQIKRIIDAAYKNVVTNMEAQHILWFAQALMGVDPSNIRFNTLPGEGRMINGGAYYVLYKKEIMDIINKYNNIYNDDLTPEKFNIYDAGARSSTAAVNIDGTTMDTMLK